MSQKQPSRKIRVVIISGALETGLHPVPPVADGAPQWNVFRLAEAAARTSDSSVEIHIVSPCDENQYIALQSYPAYAQSKYHHILFHSSQLNFYRKTLRNVLPLRLAVRRLAKLPDLFSWWYLHKMQSTLSDLKPDVIIINDRPQYIRFVRRMAAKTRLYLMVRYPVGESNRFLNLVDGIFVNSPGMKIYVEQFLLPEAPPVWLIPNTLGNDFFASKLMTQGSFHSEKMVLCVGRLIEEKGVRELMLAFRKVHIECPDSKLVICGSADNASSTGAISSYEFELRRMAATFPAGVVEFAGYVPNHQMWEYYRRATTAVFPSLPGMYIESFGMVALEAMRCGVPVVASRQPGFEELVLPGKTGLLVDDPRDTDTLAQAILEILSNPLLAQQMGEAGYKHSLNYTPEKGLQALEQVLQNYIA